MTAAEEAAPGERRAFALRVGLLVLLALVLRALEAAESSLWLDELHTLAHASQPTLGALADAVAAEYHTPLFFGCVHLFGGFEAGAWLRAVPVLSSAASLLLVVIAARGAGLSRRATLLAGWLFACLPYQVLYGSELRPYAWVGAFATIAFLLAFAERPSVLARLVAFGVVVVLGLLTHRLTAFAVLSIGVARLFARKPRSVPLWGLIAAGTLAVAAFLPWFLSFATTATDRRFDYQASVGGYTLRAVLVKELFALPARLFAPYGRELGGAWGLVELGATAAFFLLVLLAVGLAWRARRATATSATATGATTTGAMTPGATLGDAPSPLLRGLWIFALTQFLVTTGVSWYTWDRVPLQYYTPMAWALCVLVAAVVERAGGRAGARPGEHAGRTRASLPWLAPTLGAAALVMGIALVAGRSREDMRGGIAAVRELAAAAREQTGRDPVFTAVLAQPTQFPHTLPYRAYGRDLSAREPADVPRPGEEDFARPVIVLRRNVPFSDAAWRPITEGRERVREIAIDRYLTAYWFAPAR